MGRRARQPQRGAVLPLRLQDLRLAVRGPTKVREDLALGPAADARAQVPLPVPPAIVLPVDAREAAREQQGAAIGQVVDQPEARAVVLVREVPVRSLVDEEDSAWPQSPPQQRQQGG